MNHTVPWRPAENDLYDLLVDDPQGDPFHIVDLLEHEQLLDVAVADTAVEPTTAVTKACIDYINEQLDGNAHVFAPDLIRPGRYPRIRQMRDVHEFDVGSHLALCHAYAVRRGPVTMVTTLGFPRVAELLTEAASTVDPSVLGLAAVAHDLFKSFRQRRCLPSKVGGAQSIAWRLPTGEIADAALSADENLIAAQVLPHFAGHTPETKLATDSILFSGQFGSMLYRLLDLPEVEARRTADTFWHGLDGQDYGLGLYLGVTDWMGKGWAQELITYRKGRVRSLRQAGVLALEQAEAAATR